MSWPKASIELSHDEQKNGPVNLFGGGGDVAGGVNGRTGRRAVFAVF